MSIEYQVVIIGGGPAGISAALYLLRAGISCVLVESSTPGGQLNRSSVIENYPGIDNIDGPTLAYNMFHQIEQLNAKIVFDEVVHIMETENKKVIQLKNGTILCEYVIIASGRRPRTLQLEKEEKFLGKGISYCALCDGFFYKNKTVAVIGGGNTALEEALYLSNLCKKVYIIYRGERIKGEWMLLDKVQNTTNIQIIYRQEITQLLGDKTITGVKLKKNKKLSLDGIFIAIGNLPNSEFISFVDKEDNYIKVDKNYQTNVKKIFAVGDVIQKNTYQIVTAVSEGAQAASKIISDIQSK